MKTISQYQEDIKALMKKAGDIETKCINENRDPIEAELTLQNEIMDTVDEYRNIITAMERREKISKELEKPEGALTLPKNAKIEVGDDRREKDAFPTFGAQMAAVMQAGLPGGSVDPRLRAIMAATGLGETTPSDGGLI